MLLLPSFTSASCIGLPCLCLILFAVVLPVSPLLVVGSKHSIVNCLYFTRNFSLLPPSLFHAARHFPFMHCFCAVLWHFLSSFFFFFDLLFATFYSFSLFVCFSVPFCVPSSFFVVVVLSFNSLISSIIYTLSLFLSLSLYYLSQFIPSFLSLLFLSLLPTLLFLPSFPCQFLTYAFP